jgi:hypothetical protein
MTTVEPAGEDYESTTDQAGVEPVATDGGELDVARSRSIAERALLVPLGAALVAGDELRGLVATLASADKADAQLRQFEERAVAARERLELQLRRRRSQVSEWDSRIGRMREQVRDTMHDLASKRGDEA